MAGGPQEKGRGEEQQEASMVQKLKNMEQERINGMRSGLLVSRCAEDHSNRYVEVSSYKEVESEIPPETSPVHPRKKQRRGEHEDGVGLEGVRGLITQGNHPSSADAPLEFAGPSRLLWSLWSCLHQSNV